MVRCTSHLLLCCALLSPVQSFFLVARPRFAVIPVSCRSVALQDEYSTSFSSSSSSSSSSSADDGTVDFAAISPGSEVRIQVGNIELARKAWKKRRRSGSPVLIPCSVLTVDRNTMILNNILYLIQKFGTPMSESKLDIQPEGYKGKDICFTMSELNHSYRKHLGSSLAKHALALGVETARELVESLLTKEIQTKLDIQLLSTGETLWFLTHMSRYRSHRLANEAGVLQFDNGEHTGMTRIKTGSTIECLPLSAALRVSQRAVDSGIITEGSIHNAQVIALDPLGDGGSPLLKLAIHTERKFSKNKRIVEIVDARMIQRKLSDLTVGAGPFKGKVTRVSHKAMAAFIDIGVGRSVKQGQMTKVLGMLRFDDLNKIDDKNNMAYALELDLDDEDELEEEINVIENALNSMQYDDEDTLELDDTTMSAFTESMVEDLFAESDHIDDDDDNFIESEEEEDITHLISLKDGIMSYTDPETGELVSLGSLVDNDDDMDQDEDDDEETSFSGLSPEERLQTLGEWIDGEPTDMDAAKRKHVKVGDELDVYVQAVSKQSGRFMLTARPIVQNMKEVKRETELDKKLSRLITRMGGDIANIEALDGTECDGVIKATSKTGNWLYVEPQFQDLPVGVAQVADDIPIDSLSQGDSVRIRLEGLDESRGQLAMTVIRKQ